MTPDALIRAIRNDASALSAAADVGPDAPVPRYPGWCVADLVCHTGDIHRWVTRVIRERAQTRLPREALGRQVAPAALTGWFNEGVDRLVQLLETTDPAMAVWTLTAECSVRFWQRRMAHETAIHRWDAQIAHGHAQPIPSWLARTGLVEALERHLPDREPTRGAGERLRLRCRDADGDWILTILPAGIRAEPAVPSTAVNATIVGSAHDLWLLVTGRSFGAELQVDGDRVALDRFEDALQAVAVPQLA